MGITWGVWTSPSAQRRAGFPCAALGVALAIAGMGALIEMQTIELPEGDGRRGSGQHQGLGEHRDAESRLLASTGRERP